MKMTNEKQSPLLLKCESPGSSSSLSSSSSSAPASPAPSSSNVDQLNSTNETNPETQVSVNEDVKPSLKRARDNSTETNTTNDNDSVQAPPTKSAKMAYSIMNILAEKETTKISNKENSSSSPISPSPATSSVFRPNSPSLPAQSFIQQQAAAAATGLNPFFLNPFLAFAAQAASSNGASPSVLGSPSLLNNISNLALLSNLNNQNSKQQVGNNGNPADLWWFNMAAMSALYGLDKGYSNLVTASSSSNSPLDATSSAFLQQQLQRNNNNNSKNVVGNKYSQSPSNNNNRTSSPMNDSASMGSNLQMQIGHMVNNLLHQQSENDTNVNDSYNNNNLAKSPLITKTSTPQQSFNNHHHQQHHHHHHRLNNRMAIKEESYTHFNPSLLHANVLNENNFKNNHIASMNQRNFSTSSSSSSNSSNISTSSPFSTTDNGAPKHFFPNNENFYNEEQLMAQQNKHHGMRLLVGQNRKLLNKSCSDEDDRDGEHENNNNSNNNGNNIKNHDGHGKMFGGGHMGDDDDCDDENLENVDDCDDEDDMDDPNGDSFDNLRKKKTRTVFSRNQVFQLESTFDMKRYLSSSERSTLANTLQLTETQIKIWFQNRRNKWKRQLAAEVEATGNIGGSSQQQQQQASSSVQHNQILANNSSNPNMLNRNSSNILASTSPANLQSNQQQRIVRVPVLYHQGHNAAELTFNSGSVKSEQFRSNNYLLSDIESNHLSQQQSSVNSSSSSSTSSSHSTLSSPSTQNTQINGVNFNNPAAAAAVAAVLNNMAAAHAHSSNSPSSTSSSSTSSSSSSNSSSQQNPASSLLSPSMLAAAAAASSLYYAAAASSAPNSFQFPSNPSGAKQPLSGIL